MIKQVIFDMDGTLADTAKATIPALALVAKQYGFAAASDQSVLDTIGYANPEFYFRLYPALSSESVIAFGSKVEEQEKHIIFSLQEKIIIPGIGELLRALKNRGIALHVASTGDESHVCAVLEASGVKALFNSIHCGAPEKSQMVRKIIGYNPKETFAMVGDKAHDLSAARNNGIKVIAALYGYCSDADALLFDGLVRSPGELLGLL